MISFCFAGIIILKLVNCELEKKCKGGVASAGQKSSCHVVLKCLFNEIFHSEVHSGWFRTEKVKKQILRDGLIHIPELQFDEALLCFLTFYQRQEQDK